MAWHKLVSPHHGFSWTQLNLKFIYIYIYIFPPTHTPYLTYTLGVLIGPCRSVTSELLPPVLPSPCNCNCLLDVSIWVILKLIIYKIELATFPCGSAGEESTCNAEDLGSIPGLGRFPGEGKGYPLQYSGPEDSMDCVVHGVTKSLTRLSDFHFHLPLKMYFMLPFLNRIEQKSVFTFPPLTDFKNLEFPQWWEPLLLFLMEPFQPQLSLCWQGEPWWAWGISEDGLVTQERPSKWLEGWNSHSLTLLPPALGTEWLITNHVHLVEPRNSEKLWNKEARGSFLVGEHIGVPGGWCTPTPQRAEAPTLRTLSHIPNVPLHLAVHL